MIQHINFFCYYEEGLFKEICQNMGSLSILRDSEDLFRILSFS